MRERFTLWGPSPLLQFFQVTIPPPSRRPWTCGEEALRIMACRASNLTRGTMGKASAAAQLATDLDGETAERESATFGQWTRP